MALMALIGGVVELASPDADFGGRSPLFDKSAVCLKMLDALIMKVRHIELSTGVHRRTPR